MAMDYHSQAPVVKGISRRPPEPEVGVRIPAGAPWLGATCFKVAFLIDPMLGGSPLDAYCKIHSLQQVN
jgi:hypothetical protein